MRNKAFDIVEQGSHREEPLSFQIGDTVSVHCRIQEFIGIVIAHRRGNGINATFTVRKVVAGEGVERIFPVHSPKIAKLEVKRNGVVRRAKLFYLRDRVGKATRMAERRTVAKTEE